MPFYDVRDKETGEVQQVMMGISAFEEHLKANPHLEQVHLDAAMMSYNGDPRNRKPTENFRDRLKDIKATHSKGWKIGKSSINTM
jgi:hypothetical protein